MNNLVDILKLFSGAPQRSEQEIKIPKEVLDQYPYGQFPIRYTKLGQETIRKQSENRFSYESPPEQKNEQSLSLDSLLPLLQTLSSSKGDAGNMMSSLSKILFKDNPQMATLLKLFTPKHNVNIKSDTDFPNINKVEVSTLKRIN